MLAPSPDKAQAQARAPGPSSLQAQIRARLREPRVWALGLWLLAVVVSGALLFMAMVGMLNRVTTAASRESLIEVNSQILNALFTVAAVINQPTRLRLLWAHVFRRTPVARQYVRDHFRFDPPHDDLQLPPCQLTWLIVLANLNCWFQYPMAALMWGYHHSERPAAGVAICLVSSFLSGLAAGLLEIRWKQQRIDQNHLHDGQFSRLHDPDPHDLGWGGASDGSSSLGRLGGLGGSSFSGSATAGSYVAPLPLPHAPPAGLDPRAHANLADPSMAALPDGL